MAGGVSVCPFCRNEVDPCSDGSCPSCRQRVFVPTKGTIASNDRGSADETGDNPLSFLAAEPTALRVGKWAEKIASEDEKEGKLLQAIFLPKRAFLEFVQQSRLAKIFVLAVTLTAIVFVILFSTGILRDK